MGQNENVTRIRFGGFELQPGERRLLADGQPTAVGPRAFNLLVALVERAGQLVSKNELLDRVWPKLVVEENNLQVQVSALRKILGAEAIATVAGHGYRFTLKPTREVVAPAAAPAPYNLPRQVTSFVGRARELAEVRELLARTRLLTLVGFGGIGKTRLSLQVATGVADAYPDGVWLVELAPLSDARLVPQAVASVLGVREEPGRPVLEALRKHVGERHLLLLLDSCEHLLQACAELAGALLQAGPHLKLLVTSRERLHLASEASYVVPPLTLPAPNPSITLPALTEYEAVRLFVDRAVAAQPAFELTHQSAAAVADICRRVDGIPLAIELAAARARVLPVAKIAERLHDRFRLLTHGDPTALPHRQTLRAMIDWSHDLLPEPERALLRRLAMFAGGFTLEAAEAVGAGGEVQAIDVLDLLTELVEKSLVVVEAGAERYRLLDTVREYAQEQLDESGEGDQARAQHLAFYSALGEETEKMLVGAGVVASLTRLDRERANFLAAHASCDRITGGAQLGLRLLNGFRNSWVHHGMLEMGHRVTVEALSRPGAAERTTTRCLALWDAGLLSCELGRFADAQIYQSESLSIAQDLGDKRRAGEAHRGLGEAYEGIGDVATARWHFEQALALAREHGHRLALSQAITSIAEFYRGEGDLDAANPLYEESLAIGRERGEPVPIAVNLLNLAMICIRRDSRDRAVGMLLEAFEVVEKLGSKWLGQGVLEVSAGLATCLREGERAARFYGASDTQLAHMGFRRNTADEAFHAHFIAQAGEALGPAAFAAAEAAGRALSYDTAMAEVRAWLQEETTGQADDRFADSRSTRAR